MNLPETMFFTVELAPGNRASFSVGPWSDTRLMPDNLSLTFPHTDNSQWVHDLDHSIYRGRSRAIVMMHRPDCHVAMDL